MAQTAWRLAGVAAVTAITAVAAPAASADESADPDYVKTGTRVSGPANACSDGSNARNGHVKVCFAEVGDKLYVYDADRDGRSAYGEFDEHFTAFAGGDYKACRNPYGEGTWAVCSYSILPNTRVKFFGYTRDNKGVINLVRDYTTFVYDRNGS